MSENELLDTAQNAVDSENERELLDFNKSRAKKLYKLAWIIEIVLVIVGIGVAVAQAAGYQDGRGLLQVFPIFGVFVVLAVVELAKIPAATVVFHARGWQRGLALAGLLVASLISFETVFNSFERYVHTSTRQVSEARAEHAAILGDIEQLSSMALADGLAGEDVAQVDAARLARLEQSLALREQALQTARQNLESPETRELKAQLASVLEQQDAAGRAAEDAWQTEQEWIMERLNSGAIDSGTRAQLNARMRGMEARQTVILQARAQFDADIANLNAAVEQSISEPSAEALANVAAKKADRDRAADALADFEAEAAARASDRTTRLIEIEDAREERAQQIETLEAQAVGAEREIARRAEDSQMHRWASFFFGVETSEVEDNQAKLVGAVFGVFLGIVAALTGSSVAMFSEWYRVRGVRPITRTETIEVEVIVEKEVEKEIEVEIPMLRHVYVPVPMGEDVHAVVDELLETLPPEAADELRTQLARNQSAERTLTSPPGIKPAEIKDATPEGKNRQSDEPRKEGDDYARAA